MTQTYYVKLLQLHKLVQTQQQRGGNAGYVGTFLKQVREVIGPCLEQGIKIVSNAGGLNPAGMAADAQVIFDELGLTAKIAYIDGDDLMPRMAELQAAGESFTNMDKGITLAESGNDLLTAVLSRLEEIVQLALEFIFNETINCGL